MAKDSNNKTLQLGDSVTYDPSLDSAEYLFGTVPSKYHDQEAIICMLDRNPAKLHLRFKDGSEHTVAASSVLYKSSPGPVMPPDKPKPAAPVKPAKKEEEDGPEEEEA